MDGLADAPGARVAGEDRVTVVVLTHNRGGELERSLKQLTALPERPALVVVDNGSTDGTAQRVRRDFPSVELVQAPSNLGAAGRNLGVARVRTPYVAFSDDDTWWAPGALRAAADMLDAHPGIAVLAARIVVGPEAREDPACGAMARSPLERVAGAGPMLTGFMAGACVMRTSAYVQAGGYWPRFFIGGEESLLAMDLLDAGHQIVYAPALQAHHWPSEARDSGLRRRLLARNAIWTAWLRLPARLAWRRTLHCLRALPTGAARRQAAGDALSGMGAVLAARRVLKPQTCRLIERVWKEEFRFFS